MGSASHQGMKMVKSAPSRVSQMTVAATKGPLADHLKAAIVCGALGAGFLAMVLRGPPLVPEAGILVPVDKITLAPLDRPVIPGDTIRISWDQEWKELCPIKVTPRFIGSDQTPKSQQSYVLNAPDKVGFVSSDTAKRYFNLPYIAPGPATYSALLQPNCWIDNIWQREFVTPTLSFTVGAISPKQEQKPATTPMGSQHK